MTLPRRWTRPTAHRGSDGRTGAPAKSAASGLASHEPSVAADDAQATPRRHGDLRSVPRAAGIFKSSRPCAAAAAELTCLWRALRCRRFRPWVADFEDNDKAPRRPLAVLVWHPPRPGLQATQ